MATAPQADPWPGRRLRARRIELGLKTAEVARHLGLTEVRCRQIEGSVKPLSERTVTRYLAALEDLVEQRSARAMNDRGVLPRLAAVEEVRNAVGPTG